MKQIMLYENTKKNHKLAINQAGIYFLLLILLSQKLCCPTVATRQAQSTV